MMRTLADIAPARRPWWLPIWDAAMALVGWTMALVAVVVLWVEAMIGS